MTKDAKRSDKSAEPPEETNSARNDPPASKDAPLGMDEGEAARGRKPGGGKVTEPAPAEEARQGEKVVVCPYCGSRCKSNGTDAFFTRYYCPTKGCGFSHKEPRPNLQQRINRRRVQEENEKGHSARD